MKEFKYTIADQFGMHARPAGRLATYAKQFESDITVRAGEKEADCKRLLSLMSLGATTGTVLHFQISGGDEDDACRAMEHFCNDIWETGNPE